MLTRLCVFIASSRENLTMATTRLGIDDEKKKHTHTHTDKILQFFVANQMEIHQSFQRLILELVEKPINSQKCHFFETNVTIQRNANFI